MNDEIREILEQLEWYRKIGKKDVYYPECVLPNKKAFILLDYITNLQKENEDYKSRVEKAVEYIKNEGYLEEGYMIPVVEEKPLLNILQNGSDEE